MHGQGAPVPVEAVARGTVRAVAIVFVNKPYIVGRHGVPAPSHTPQPGFDTMVVDSVVIGGCVGLSLLAAHALQLERMHWVPVRWLVVETLVLRLDGPASVCLTPMAILLAEAGQGFSFAPLQLMQARLADTVVGALLGLAGAACQHNLRCLAAVGAGLRRLLRDG